MTKGQNKKNPKGKSLHKKTKSTTKDTQQEDLFNKPNKRVCVFFLNKMIESPGDVDRFLLTLAQKFPGENPVGLCQRAAFAEKRMEIKSGVKLLLAGKNPQVNQNFSKWLKVQMEKLSGNGRPAPAGESEREKSESGAGFSEFKKAGNSL